MKIRRADKGWRVFNTSRRPGPPSLSPAANIQRSANEPSVRLVPLEKRHENDRSKDQANTHPDCNGDSQAFRSPDNLGHRFVIIRDED